MLVDGLSLRRKREELLWNKYNIQGNKDNYDYQTRLNRIRKLIYTLGTTLKFPLTGKESLKEMRKLIDKNHTLFYDIKKGGKGRTKKVIAQEINQAIYDNCDSDDDDNDDSDIVSE